ncbi:Cell cycle checkpoint control protein RAD9B [Eumeta japonica]|uniref:Cell cycle checkpoint control protein RAD9B n=1 Tax=Eumeta variegata TaxID=151549 RepID=A0A4C1Y1H4_EUMVA|nr:Cell cycle checkpoint control protein RAD9B [Eumeta japonica]
MRVTFNVHRNRTVESKDIQLLSTVLNHTAASRSRRSCKRGKTNANAETITTTTVQRTKLCRSELAAIDILRSVYVPVVYRDHGQEQDQDRDLRSRQDRNRQQERNRNRRRSSFYDYADEVASESKEYVPDVYIVPVTTVVHAARDVHRTNVGGLRISAHQRVLSEALSNLHRSNELITLEASAQCLLLRNYIDTTVDFSKLIRTQISLKPAEFDTYAINSDTVITFTLKEFKALLAFAEALNLPIQLHFQTTGLPIVFIVQNNVTFEAHFILATSKADAVTQTTATQNTPFKERVKRKDSTANNDNTRKKPYLLQEENISKCLEEDSHLFNFIDLPGDVNYETLNDNVQNENAQTSKNNCDINFNDCNISPNENLMNYENIPPSPSAKNTVKLVFSRCFEKTFDLRCIPRIVLADNSDSE